MSSTPETLLVVGGGMAAGRLLERLVQCGYPGRVVVVGEERTPAYNRVLLPGYLAGRHEAAALVTRDTGWFADHGIELVLGQRATVVEPDSHRLRLADGRELGFDRLVLATGARVPLPGIPGTALPGVTTLRSLAEADVLHRLAADATSAVVVGGGLLGLEAAQSLLDLGLAVHVVHRNPRLMNRQLDADGAALLAAELTRRGMQLHLGTGVNAVRGSERVCAVELSNRLAVRTDIVVFATGTAPDDALAHTAGLRCDRGVCTDTALRTSHPDIFAVGECARVDGHSYALVEPVFRQADALAWTLCGQIARFEPPVPATRLKVSGVELFAAGELDAADPVLVRDPARGVYRRLAFRGERLVGAVLMGDLSGSPEIAALISERTAVRGAEARSRAAFGIFGS